MTTTLSPARSRALRTVFGDAVPKDPAAALRMLADSPVLQASAAERLALREAVVAHAGQKLDQAADRPAGGPASSTAARALPGGVAIRLVEAALAARTKDGLAAVVTPDHARRLFDDAAAMPDVPWTFLEEGCIHRAHVVAKRLEERGVFSEKIFAIPQGGEDLVIETDKAKLGYTVVWFHVANVVHTVDEKGERRRAVIDPSVADRPLSVEEWSAAMHGAKGAALETFYLPRFASQLYHRDAPPAAWLQDDLDAAFAWGEDAPSLEQDYVKSGFYAEVAKLAGRDPPAWAVVA